MRLVCLLTLTVITTLAVTSANKTKESSEDVSLRRSKRFAAALPVSGLFSFVLKVFKIGWDIGQDVKRMKTDHRREQQLTKMQSQMESVKLELDKVHSSIGQLEKNIGAEIRLLRNDMIFRTTLAGQTTSVVRMSELANRFFRLNMSETDEIRNWIRLMLTDDPHGVQTVLYNVHVLVVGDSLIDSYSLYQLFYDKCVDNENQSRLWKTEAFADLYLTKQMELYGLWIKALKFKKGKKMKKNVGEVEKLRNERLDEQLTELLRIRNASGTYQVNVDAEYDGGVRRFCSATPKCLSRGYRLAKEGDSSRIDFGCDEESGSFDPDFSACNQAESRFKRHASISFFHRLLSTKMLVVPDPLQQTICGVSVWEETDEEDIYVRLSANVCWKNVTGEANLVPNVSPLRSDNSALRGIRWPYRLAPAKLPNADGWVTGVGLDVTEEKSIILTLITDYFPSPLLKGLQIPV